MTRSINSKNVLTIAGKVVIILGLLSAVILSGKFTDFMNGPGLAFVILGGISLTLISFSFKEMALVFKHTSGRSSEPEEQRKAGYFWETAVRNFWMMGVLASVIRFVIALGNSEGGLFSIATRMSASYLSAIYGMILAVIFSVPALKISQFLDTRSKEERPQAFDIPEEAGLPFLNFETVIGYVLFIFSLGWAIFIPISRQTSDGPLHPQDLFLYWPSLLVVLGGTITIALFMGKAGIGRFLTVGFALTGLLATLMGFVQAMFGFSTREIQGVAAAITFILSASIVALLGMMLVGNPLEDRTVKARKSQKSLTLSRIVWLVFPLIVLILLFFTFMLVVTPIQKG